MQNFFAKFSFLIVCSKKHHSSDYYVRTSGLISMWPIAFFQIAFAVAPIQIHQFFHNLHWLGTCLKDSCVCICRFTTMSQFNCILKNLLNPTLYKLPCWIVWARVHQTSMVLTNYISTLGRWAQKAENAPNWQKMSRRAHCWPALGWRSHFFICLGLHCHKLATTHLSAFISIYFSIQNLCSNNTWLLLWPSCSAPPHTHTHN